ncbi:hypothetical protein MTR_6g042235 [Medicago truncatula]|uniref:Uncharacterized protein n=1 Tax=Medicago truncatula TaxID=3880 RepID=A0A072UAC7_MEDTR|nr:hypothetical protein MTR_6g042235 [Medicago truncatula]
MGTLNKGFWQLRGFQQFIQGINMEREKLQWRRKNKVTDLQWRKTYCCLRKRKRRNGDGWRCESGGRVGGEMLLEAAGGFVSEGLCLRVFTFYR